MGERLGVGQIIDCDEVNLLVSQSRPQDVAPDPAKTIDANFDCHFSSPVQSDWMLI
jgi:hypothetical protein